MAAVPSVPMFPAVCSPAEALARVETARTFPAFRYWEAAVERAYRAHKAAPSPATLTKFARLAAWLDALYLSLVPAAAAEVAR